MRPLLRIAERRMMAEDPEPSEIYDRVAGKADDPEYEVVRRERTISAIKSRTDKDEAIARRLIWC